MNGTLVFAATLLAVVSAAPPALAHDGPAARWVTTWTAPPMPADSTFPPAPLGLENQTVRQIVHVSVGGRRVRVQLSNVFGATTLRIGSARVALHGQGGAILPGSDRALRFSGQSSIAIPKGAVALSDPVDLDVPTRGDLAVSLYLPEPTGPPTFRAAARQTTYISEPGDFTDAVSMPVQRTTLGQLWLNVVEVSTRETIGALVAFGDSITLGGQATLDAHRTWPDQLSARLNPRGGEPRLAVLNQGIGCGRLLFDLCGPNGSARFERDVLAITGVSHVIVALGLNDIGIPTILGIPEEMVTAEEIIVGLAQLLARGRDKGLAMYGATITPVGSSVVPGFFTPENEAKRQQVNHWIRTSRAFDGVIDFDRVVRDPGQPTRLLPAFNSGDGIHLNDAGYLAMAQAIDLSMLRR